MDNDWDLAIKYREIKPWKMDNDGYEGQNGSWHYVNGDEVLTRGILLIILWQFIYERTNFHSYVQ